MTKENLYEPFSVVYKTLDACAKHEHQHTFFELVYIISGTGTQCINKSTFQYHAGHMFLITPEDCHSLEIATTTSFFFLRFNDIYLKNNGLPAEHIHRLEYVLQNANHRPGCILKNQTDKLLVAPVVDAIIREYETRDVHNHEMVQQLVNTLIVVVARNIAKYLPEQISLGRDEKAMDILQYIQGNIYDPEKLRAGHISNIFGISEAYLGRFFKKHANETMQQYVTNYKTKLIEHRLQFSEKRISEIAGEFGFADESHFNKFFKKQKGHSPKAYRNMIRA
ncbi:AraC family transcriptional regulator [Dyadobacter sp. CY312]|uniref:helix-turn-helix domain-containing protein n=1 Tax=Dyadobacter sp. CY312 TaxID=2907303 RepID=UPI001F20CE67|nr:AraC family transcriptional regulator [Dyadobacter sp. CY312]MCE7042433.1 AraC family transcriptional regulator [Dyadobacter sp. CY312]